MKATEQFFPVYIMSKVSEPVVRKVFKSQGNSTCHTPRFRKNSSLEVRHCVLNFNSFFVPRGKPYFCIW